MLNRTWLLGLTLALLGVGIAGAQYPIPDAIGTKVVQKYQRSSCEQLWQEKAQENSPTEEEQQAMQLLRNDPQTRAAFVNLVAAPIVDKMITCSMIP